MTWCTWLKNEVQPQNPSISAHCFLVVTVISEANVNTEPDCSKCFCAPVRNTGEEETSCLVRLGGGGGGSPFQTSWYNVIVKWPLGWDCSISRVSDGKARHNKHADLMWLSQAGRGFFPPGVNFGADSLTMLAQPPCAVTCISICAGVSKSQALAARPICRTDTQKCGTHW